MLFIASIQILILLQNEICKYVNDDCSLNLHLLQSLGVFK